MRMRKLAIITTMLFLLFQSLIGIHRYAHYCGDELSSQSLFVADQGTCECPEEEEEGCCTNEVSVYQQLLEFIDNPTDNIFQVFHHTLFIDCNQFISSLCFTNDLTQFNINHYKPDRVSSIPLYLNFSVFRI